MHNLIFGPALFYDIPEYIHIVTTTGFWQSLTLGHFPIHPVFIGVLWLVIKIIPVNLIAMLFTLVSAFLVFKISRKVFKKSNRFWAVMIFLLFPIVFLTGINLTVESITLTFFLAALYFFLTEKGFLFSLFIFLMVGSHLQSIFWIPAILITPTLLEIKLSKKKLMRFVKLSIAAVILSGVFYLVLYKLGNRVIEGQTEQLTAYLSGGILRMLRNIWLSFYTDFGSLTLLILILHLAKNLKTKTQIVSWVLFLGLVALIGANWQGDLMGRRILFAAPILALSLAKYLNKKSLLFGLYLLPITLANLILYADGSPFNNFDIPKSQALVETSYLHPFTKYDGTILWTNSADMNKIDGFLNAGTRVFLTKSVVTAPYLLFVGNNYHITSIGKVGTSETEFLFKKYTVKPYGNVYELKRYSGTISPDAGERVVSYDPSFWGRLARRRIDYGDIGTWFWALITNHRDPVTWTYKDATGAWVWPNLGIN